MRDNTGEDYAKFEQGLVKLYYECFGEDLTQWVLPVLSLDDELKVKEDILVPENQLVQNTMGMLTWAEAELKAVIINREEEDDD